MREIELRVLNEVGHFDKREAFSGWMRKELKGLYASSQITTTSQFRNYLADKESVVVFFGNIYEELPENKKMLFRQSIGDTLLQYGNEEDAPPGALHDLIYIIPRTKAVESLHAFVPTIGNGSLGRKHPEYLYSAIAVLDFLSPSSQAQETMSQLIDSSNFDDGYLFDAIGVLIKCDPHDTSNLLVHFQPRLEKLRQNVEKLGSDKENNAFRNSAESLMRKIQRLDPLANPNAIKEVFFGSRAPGR